MVVAFAHEKLDRLARILHRGGEVARLALEFRSFAGADGKNERRVEIADEPATAPLRIPR